MAKKLKILPNFLHNSPRLWRSCTQSRTLSFRISGDIFRTMNSIYDEETPQADMLDEDQIEALVRGLKARPGKRLFLELEETNLISEAVAVAENGEVPFEESVVMEMDSKEPYLDFKKSMEEMVEAHGLKDWKGMEILLSWYLKANSKANHEFIIGAFVDLLVGLDSTSPNHFSCCLCNNSPTSSSTSILCSSYSFASSSHSPSSSFRDTNCVIQSNSIEVMEDIVESGYNTLSSLFENHE